MATTSTFTYECTVSELLLCPVCTDPFINAQRIDPCGHTFCSECVTNWFLRQRRCPECRGPVSSINPADRIVRGLLDKLEITCATCSFKGPRDRHNSAKCIQSSNLAYVSTFLDLEASAATAFLVNQSTGSKLVSVLVTLRENPENLALLVALLSTRKYHRQCTWTNAFCIYFLTLRGKSVSLQPHLEVLIRFLVSDGCNCVMKCILEIIDICPSETYHPAMEYLVNAIGCNLFPSDTHDVMSTFNESLLLHTILRRFPNHKSQYKNVMKFIMKHKASPIIPNFLLQEFISLGNMAVLGLQQEFMEYHTTFPSFFISHLKTATSNHNLIQNTAIFITNLCSIFPTNSWPFALDFLEIISTYIQQPHTPDCIDPIISCIESISALAPVLKNDLVSFLEDLMGLLQVVWDRAKNIWFMNAAPETRVKFIGTLLNVYTQILQGLRKTGKALRMRYHLDSLFRFMNWCVANVKLPGITVIVLLLIGNIGDAFPAGDLYRLYQMDFIEQTLQNALQIQPKVTFHTLLFARTAILKQLIPVTQLITLSILT